MVTPEQPDNAINDHTINLNDSSDSNASHLLQQRTVTTSSGRYSRSDEHNYPQGHSPSDIEKTAVLTPVNINSPESAVLNNFSISGMEKTTSGSSQNPKHSSATSSIKPSNKKIGDDLEGSAIKSDKSSGRTLTSDNHKSEIPDLSGSRSPIYKAVGSRIAAAASHTRGPLRATLQIRRIDPWSTFKVGLLLSIVLFFVWMIAVALLYLLLGFMGVWSKLNSNVGELLNNSSGSVDLVSAASIFGGAALIGLVNIVIFTALATLGAIIYNLSTDVVGGIEVTLADQD